MDDDRIGCIAPGCQRSWKLKPGEARGEVLCGRHFKMASPDLRQRFKLAKRAYSGMARRLPTRIDHAELQRLDVVIGDLWYLIKAASAETERPIGLDAALEEIGVR